MGLSGTAGAATSLEAMLPRRLDAAENERELLRVGLAALRALVPTGSAMALFTLPSYAEETGCAACVESFSPRLEHPARGALRDALRRVTCGDPSTSVAFLCDPSAGDGGGWCAADSRDWPEGAATFSDWTAALGSEDARESSVCFLTLAISPTGGGGGKAPVAAALLRFENHKLGRFLNGAAALTGWRMFTAAMSSPPLARDAAPLHRFCGIIGDALAARRDKAAAAAAAAEASHVNALARDVYPEHLIPAMKARHSTAPMAHNSGGSTSTVGTLVAQDMLCENHPSVTIIFAGAPRLRRTARALCCRCRCTSLTHPLPHACADVCRWTELAGSMSAQEAMGVLDRLWQRLDTLSVAHGCYKVETIGDSYMAVAGMLPKRPDHAAAALRFALDMHEAAAATELRPGAAEDEEGADEYLAIRVGLHTGPCTSGIIGNLRARFCLFGAAGSVCSAACARVLRPHAAPARSQPQTHTQATA